MASNLYFGGIPTKPDVIALINKFGVPEEGVLISYNDVCEVINVEQNTHRFKGVTGVWRRHLIAEYNIIMEAIANQGFQRMTPSERIAFAAKKMKQQTKAINRSVEVLITTPKERLSSDELMALDHWQKYGNQAILTLRTAPKKQLYPDLDVAS